MTSILSSASSIEFLDELSMKLESFDCATSDDIRRLDEISNEFDYVQRVANRVEEEQDNYITRLEIANDHADQLLNIINDLVYSKNKIKKADLIHQIKVAFDDSSYEL